MNTVFLQSEWNGLVKKATSLDGLVVRENRSFEDLYQIGGEVEIYMLSSIFKKIELETKGFLQHAECRFETVAKAIPLTAIKQLGFTQNEARFIFSKNDYCIEIATIEDEGSLIWKVKVQISGYTFNQSCAQLLTRLISLIKYEMDIKNDYGLLAVV